ncbi:MAG: O-antigen ligase family protein [Anaerolineae bacterium]|nr:O-antigen ligase family protein [Anaerolineae bacterium]
MNLSAIRPRFVTLFTLYITMAGGSYALYHLVLPVRVFHHLFMTLFLVWWFLRRGLPASPFTFPLLIMTGWVSISVAFAIDQRMAIEFAWHWVVNIALVFVLIDWARQGQLPAVYRGLFWGAAFLASTMVYQGLTAPQYRAAGAFVIVNLAGAYLAALFMPMWFGKLYARNWTLVIWLLALTSALLFNQSRGAWLAVIISGAICAGLRWPGFRAWMLPVGVLGIAVIVSSLHSTGRLAGDELRLHLWSAAGELIQQRPLTGVGPGLFAQGYYQLDTALYDARMTGPHNYYLSVASELGLPALLIGAWLLWSLWRTLPHSLTNQQLAALGGLGGILAHMLVDNYPVTAYAFVVAVFAVTVWGEVRPPVLKPQQLYHGNVGYLVFFATVGWWFLLVDFAQWRFEQSWRGYGLPAAQQAARLDPLVDLYQLNVARLAGEDVQATVGAEVNLEEWAMTNYGRLWR